MNKFSSFALISLFLATSAQAAKINDDTCLSICTKPHFDQESKVAERDYAKSALKDRFHIDAEALQKPIRTVSQLKEEEKNLLLREKELLEAAAANPNKLKEVIDRVKVESYKLGQERRIAVLFEQYQAANRELEALEK